MRSLKTADSIRNACRVHRFTASTAATASFYTTQTHMTSMPRVHTKKKPEEPQVPRSWKPFNLPNVVLDLDGWDTAYTRPYDKTEMQAQSEKWSHNPQRDALLQRIKRFDNDLKWAKSNHAPVIEGSSWDPWQVADIDIMTAALKGAPKHRRHPTAKRPYGADSDGVLSTVAFKNGIPLTSYQDEKRLLEWLLHRRFSTSQVGPIEAQIPSLIVRQTTAKDLRRLVSILLSSDDHCRTVLQNTDRIAKVLLKMLTVPGTERFLIGFLPFFNSIFDRCQQRGDSLGLPLCGIFLRISAEAFQLRSLAKYLEYGFRKGYWSKDPRGIPEVLAAMRTLVMQMGKGKDDTHVTNGAGDLRKPDSPSARDQSSNDEVSKQLLRRLLTHEGSIKAGATAGAWIKVIVESNPANQELRRLYQQLVDAVNYQPPAQETT